MTEFIMEQRKKEREEAWKKEKEYYLNLTDDKIKIYYLKLRYNDFLVPLFEKEIPCKTCVYRSRRAVMDLVPTDRYDSWGRTCADSVQVRTKRVCLFFNKDFQDIGQGCLFYEVDKLLLEQYNFYKEEVKKLNIKF